MMPPKENFLEVIRKNGKPQYLPACYDACVPIGGDPVFQFVRGNRIRGTESIDRWGTHISFPADAPAAVPLVTEQNQVIQDLENWRDYVRVPDLRGNCSAGWESVQEEKAAVDSSKYLTISIMGTGIFEQLHMLMTFENTLMGFLEYPEQMHELIAAITEYRLEYMKLLVENLHPDMIVSHDDFGSRTSLFMSPNTWREFFKEPYRKLYRYLHENGVIVMHHADSFCEPIVEDLAEIGVDIWQGVLPTNNIPAMTEKLQGRMALMGGIDSIIDREDVPEDEIREEVRRALRDYGDLPHFIPSITYGGPGTIYPQVEPVIIDEIHRWNREKYGI